MAADPWYSAEYYDFPIYYDIDIIFFNYHDIGEDHDIINEDNEGDIDYYDEGDIDYFGEDDESDIDYYDEGDYDYYYGTRWSPVSFSYYFDRLSQVYIVEEVWSQVWFQVWPQGVVENENDDTEAFVESFNSQPVRFVPASNSSIEGLEKVRVEGVAEHCTVCLEDILVGTEAARMPCNHVYHGDCITTWLRTSNLCPLCRFSMP